MKIKGLAKLAAAPVSAAAIMIGVAGGTVAPASAIGTLYFDVVGDVPNSVVYNDGFTDLMAWIPGPPQGGTRP